MSALHDRWLRAVAAMGSSRGPDLAPAAMVAACADLLAVDGAAIVVMAGDGLPGATYTSGSMAGALDELQFLLGVGPGVDAYTSGVPILATELAAWAERWPGFCGPAMQAGARAVFAFPLQIGAARIGALTIYRAKPGPLDDASLADALTMTNIITRSLLAIQAGLPDVSLADEVRDGDGFDASVHQASGMISVQLGVGVGEALVRMRARTFADGITLDFIATEIVAGRIRFCDQ
jgi:hypothetical protein